MIAAVAQAREAIAVARSAADDASEASRAVRASDPTLPESHAAAMADAEVARNNFDTVRWRCRTRDSVRTRTAPAAAPPHRLAVCWCLRSTTPRTF